MQGWGYMRQERESLETEDMASTRGATYPCLEDVACACQMIKYHKGELNKVSHAY